MKRRMKKIVSIILVCAILCVTGCGNAQPEEETNTDNKKNKKEQNKDSDSKETAMGRYLESDCTLPENLFGIDAMEKLDDGSIALFDATMGMYLSQDGGQSFELANTEIADSLRGKYVWRASIGKDGSLFAAYMGGDENVPEEDSEEPAEEEGEEDGSSVNSKYLYMDKDKNIKEVVLPEANSLLFFAYCTLTDGKVLAADAEAVYMIDAENDTCELFCSTDGYVDHLKEINNRVYMIGRNTLVYNLETEEFEDDHALKEFVEDNSLGGNASDRTSPFVLCEGDTDDSLYIASSNGVFRHIVGGNVLEEVIKGSLSSMGSPANGLSSLIEKNDKEFLISYNGSFLKNYVYDASVSALPENEISIYSLKDNLSIRQLINTYQNKNPETFLLYEVGMNEDSGMTREDAIRNLNTSLLSGDGPDIILLDNMPVESYIAKGVLADLSPKIEEAYKENELLESVKNSYKKGDSIYGLPMFFSIPMLVSKENKSLDLKGLADEVETLREQYPEGKITGKRTEKEVLGSLYNVSSAAWQKEDGTIDKEKLVEFLTQSKRIYQAEMQGFTPDQISNFTKDYRVGIFSEGLYRMIHIDSMEYISERIKILFGELNGMTAYSDITSVLKQKNEDSSIISLGGMVENIFVPNTIFGVNEASSSKEAAIDFILSAVSSEMQGMDMGAGFPIQKQAREAFFDSPMEEAEDGGLYMVGTSDEDGNEESLTVFWPTEEEIEKLKAVIEQLETPAYIDSTLEEVVYEIGSSALNGEKSVEDAANEIINKMQIYLSE